MILSSFFSTPEKTICSSKWIALKSTFKNRREVFGCCCYRPIRVDLDGSEKEEFFARKNLSSYFLLL
jgi:hypothetical protein